MAIPAPSFAFLTLVILTTIPAVMSPATAQDQISRGKSLAEQNCAVCHAIGNDDESAYLGAPPFRTLSARYPVADLAEALAEGIVSGHPDMPELEFAPDEVDALIHYLQSVQPK